MKPYRVAPTAACLLAASAAVAAGKDCEELRTEIVAKFHARGVDTPSLKILPASEATSGRTVGTCELGTKKLVLLPGEYKARTGASSQKPPATSVVRPRDEILTECKDGSVSVGGSCGRK